MKKQIHLCELAVFDDLVFQVRTPLRTR